MRPGARRRCCAPRRRRPATSKELAPRYGFSLPVHGLNVAVNDEFRDWDTPLADGDTVVFIAPVAGG